MSAGNDLKQFCVYRYSYIRALLAGLRIILCPVYLFSDLGETGFRCPQNFEVTVSLVKTGALKIETRFMNAKNEIFLSCLVCSKPHQKGAWMPSGIAGV